MNNSTSDRYEKLKILLENNINPFPNNLKVSHTIGSIIVQIELNSDEFTSSIFTIAGRIMSKTKFGKTTFIWIKDHTGKIQTYFRKDKLTDYDILKNIDIGDFIRVSGKLFQTKTGEWTIFVDQFCLVCKSIQSLPEKYHGIVDPEKRYRKRYLDLIMNETTYNNFKRRSEIIYLIRQFLTNKNYMEVETPMMHNIPGGADAEPFKTHHNALNVDSYLRISPELYLKRLIVGGFEKIFELNRSFRNEGISTKHNPEFTLLEFYQTYSTYKDLMVLTEELFSYISYEIFGTTNITYQDETIQLGGPSWLRLTLQQSLIDIGGIPKNILNSKTDLLSFANKKNIKISKTEHIGQILIKLFDLLVEPYLIQPTFITGYPVDISPLSRRNNDNPDITDRFELFIGGFEIANGFSELNDPIDQHDRFLKQIDGDPNKYMDEDYIEALEYGMPPTAGEGIGIDRLVMLLTNSNSIRDVILFPHMRPNNL